MVKQLYVQNGIAHFTTGLLICKLQSRSHDLVITAIIGAKVANLGDVRRCLHRLIKDLRIGGTYDARSESVL